MVESMPNRKKIIFSVYKQIRKIVEKSNAVYCREINKVIANRVANENNISSIKYLDSYVYDFMNSSEFKLKQLLVKPVYLMMFF